MTVPTVDPTPLTLDELIAQLSAVRDRQPELGRRPVELPWDPGHTTVGGTPAVKLTGVHTGIDWDHNRVFLRPATPIGQLDGEMRKRVSKAENLVGRLLWLLRRPEEPAKTLAHIQSHLDHHLGRDAAAEPLEKTQPPRHKRSPQ